MRSRENLFFLWGQPAGTVGAQLLNLLPFARLVENLWKRIKVKLIDAADKLTGCLALTEKRQQTAKVFKEVHRRGIDFH